MTILRVLWLLATLLLEGSDGNGDGDGNDDDDTDPDADHQDEPEDDAEIKDPARKIQALEEQRARFIRKLDKKDKRIRELEAATGDAETFAALRQENAFLRSAIASGHHTIDLDTAFTLMTSKGFLDAVEIAEDGEVEGMDEAFEKMLARYPWLADEDIPEDDDEPDRTLGRSGRPVGAKRKKGSKQPDNATYQRRFPALRGRVRVPR